MIDHLGVTVTDYERSKRFFEAALKPLGYALLMEYPTGQGDTKICGFGDATTQEPDFWLAPGKVASTNHVAFRAKSRADVEAFHRAALAAGGRDNGPPGLRTQYHPNYFGAFVFDPDGHNIEAVCHTP
jgi:catechol 2,3-dioxygenase-like lactoylglutathione lyase family enzyme